MTHPLIDVIVLYGGRSTEHEISKRSAAFALKHLDRSCFRVHAVGITPDGEWIPQREMAAESIPAGPVPIHPKATGAPVSGQLGKATIRDVLFSLVGVAQEGVDTGRELVVLPMLHGTNGEDGTLQGLLEQAEVAFVGPDTLGSAIGMDKVVAKRLAQAAGVPVVPWTDVRAHEWVDRADDLCSAALEQLGLPLFVKPARLGSSVGVTKVVQAQALKAACEAAFRYDDRILIEKGFKVREIEVAILGGYDPQVSVPGEVIPHADFYSYDAKYIDQNGASMAIPAKLTPEKSDEAQRLARQVFMGLDLFGMSRVDLFLEEASQKFYFNEVNTIPGFTEISQYPLLWQASGVPAKDLLTRLVQLALDRLWTKRKLARSKL